MFHEIISQLRDVLVFVSQLTLVDWVVLLVVLLYAVEGYAVGAIAGILDIAGFLISFGVGLKLYKPLGTFISSFTHLPSGLSHATGFLVAALLTELILRTCITLLMPSIRRLPWPAMVLRLNRLLGILPGILAGAVLLSFLLTVLTILPVASPLKEAINHSLIGSGLVAQSQSFEKDLTGIFGGKPTDLLTFLTVEPQENSLVHLDFTVTDGRVDQLSEQQMLAMVNKERTNRGLTLLVSDDALQALARAHSQDMLARGYFSHYTLEGKSPFDRMNDAGIIYQYAGENLAFSATTDLAMQGLMQSPGHRANILSPNFHKVGIGVVNAGIYGEMFSQEFTD